MARHKLENELIAIEVEEVCISIMFSQANRKKGDISFGRTNLQLALAFTNYS